jgi:hypothetical protein
MQVCSHTALDTNMSGGILYFVFARWKNIFYTKKRFVFCFSCYCPSLFVQFLGIVLFVGPYFWDVFAFWLSIRWACCGDLVYYYYMYTVCCCLACHGMPCLVSLFDLVVGWMLLLEMPYCDFCDIDHFQASLSFLGIHGLWKVMSICSCE